MTTKLDNKNKFKAKIFRALSDPVRLNILEFLHDGEKCVCEIIPHVGLIQPVVSRHLKILKDCGIIRSRKDGTNRYYAITDLKTFQIINSITPELADIIKEKIIQEIT